MYQHHPRPKEFIMKYRIQVGVEHKRCVLEGTGSGVCAFGVKGVAGVHLWCLLFALAI
jgi:hypothetical protein